MTNIHYATVVSKQSNSSYVSVFIVGVLYFFLLLMRDAYSIGINRFIFLAIICLCSVIMKTDHLIYVYCFLFPLYVGLPGNYMTIVLIMKLIFKIHRFKSTSLLLSITTAIYMLIQNIITKNTGIVPMMFIGSIILILFLFTYSEKLEPLPMILMYSAGVASLGLIMLLSTLKVYNLTDLMSTAFRLGSSNISYVEEGIMNISVDPNFYGMFSIASISMCFPILFNSKTKGTVKTIILVNTIIQLIVCLIGLSRTFVIVFIIWLLLYLLSQKNIKGMMGILIISITLVILFMQFMPNVIETVIERFYDTDMATGNGRLELIQVYFSEWASSIITIFFGVGMFNCTVHCMPLQFLFGGGLTMFVLTIALFISYKPSRMIFNLTNFLPLLVTIIMMCTVPAANLLNYMFPLVLIVLIMNTKKMKGREVT